MIEKFTFISSNLCVNLFIALHSILHIVTILIKRLVRFKTWAERHTRRFVMQVLFPVPGFLQTANLFLPSKLNSRGKSKRSAITFDKLVPEVDKL